MMGVGYLKWMCRILATTGLLVSASMVLAGQSSVGEAKVRLPETPRWMDVALQKGATLRGTVVDTSGFPMQQVPISVRQMGKDVATTMTDRDGRFEVRGLDGGAYEVLAGRVFVPVRAWARDTAPPIALNHAVIVGERTVVRGNRPPWLDFRKPLPPNLDDPALWAVGWSAVSAGIMIPVATHYDDEAEKIILPAKPTSP